MYQLQNTLTKYPAHALPPHITDTMANPESPSLNAAILYLPPPSELISKRR